jgi:beta-N-acetylhexosaminidase
MIDELVGQLIWGFISARDDITLAEESARKGHLSGIWLLPTEMRSAQDTATLINRLQMASPQPLLVGVDAEAGLGLVMGTATHLPTAMALGATKNPDLVRDAAIVTGLEASACGINAIAAPVLDVNVNPSNPIINVRSFGGDPDLVARLGVTFVEALRACPDLGGQVLPIGKHVPGHGDTARDSHLHLDAVTADRRRLAAVELAPFRAAIEAQVPLLMTAHVAYPALDPSGAPATLSYPIMTELLRGELGYTGAVVTDCMNMHAIAHNFEPQEAAVLAVLAGCDLVMTDQWGLVYEGLMRATLDGRLQVWRLEEAVARVRRVKEMIFGSNLDHLHPIDPQVAQWSVGTPAHIEVADRIASAAITALDGTLVPPSPHPLLMATRMARRFGPPVELQLRNALEAVGWPDADIMMLDPQPDPAETAKAIEAARRAGWAALLHFNRVESFDPDAVLMSDELVALVDEIAATEVPVAAVSMGTPYALSRVREAVARLCSYSTCDASLRATLRVLKGESSAPGVLPVELQPIALAT